MRNWTIGGIAIVLLCESASAETSAVYRTVQEICLFSSFLAPAESSVALRSLNTFRDPANVYDVSHDFETPPATKDSMIFLSARSAVIAAGNPLKGVYELRGGDWRATGSGIGERILVTESDWTNFALNGGDSTGDGKMTFVVSTVPALGVEHNGFVAGFNFKF
jgi:hypothetical protein